MLKHHEDPLNGAHWVTEHKNPPEMQPDESHERIRPGKSAVVSTPGTQIPPGSMPVKAKVPEPKRASISRGSKSRKKGTHLWMYVLAGLSVSLVSGSILLTWISGSGDSEFSLSPDMAVAYGEIASGIDRAGENGEQDIQGNQLAELDKSLALLNEKVRAVEMESSEGSEPVNEGTFDSPAIASADTIPNEIDELHATINSVKAAEAVSNVGNSEDRKSDLVSPQENAKTSKSKADSTGTVKIAQQPLKENTAIAESKPVSHSEQEKNASAEPEITATETLNETADQKPDVITSKSLTTEKPVPSSHEDKKDKVTQTARRLLASATAGNRMPPVSSDRMPSGHDDQEEGANSNSKVTETHHGKRDQASGMTIAKETAGITQVSFSEKLLKEDMAERPNVDISGNRKDINSANNSELAHHDKVPAVAAEKSNPDNQKTGTSSFMIRTLADRGESIPSMNSLRSETAEAVPEPLKAKPAVYTIVDQEDHRNRKSIPFSQHRESAPGSSAQNFHAAKTVTLKEMSVTYEDQFNDHNNNWPEYDSEHASVLIEDGMYHVEHKAKSGSHIVLHPYGVSNDMNYMIQIDIHSVLGSGNHSYGFVFGGKDLNNNYSFQVSSDNLYSIRQLHNGNEVELAGGHIDNVFISKGTGKTLKIVKMRNKLRFYVDDYYMDELANVEFPGDKVGFLVKGQVRISVDSTRTEIKFSSN